MYSCWLHHVKRKCFKYVQHFLFNTLWPLVWVHFPGQWNSNFSEYLLSVVQYLACMAKTSQSVLIWVLADCAPVPPPLTRHYIEQCITWTLYIWPTQLQGFLHSLYFVYSMKFLCYSGGCISDVTARLILYVDFLYYQNFALKYQILLITMLNYIGWVQWTFSVPFSNEQVRNMFCITGSVRLLFHYIGHGAQALLDWMCTLSMHVPLLAPTSPLSYIPPTLGIT